MSNETIQSLTEEFRKVKAKLKRALREAKDELRDCEEELWDVRVELKELTAENSTLKEEISLLRESKADLAAQMEREAEKTNALATELKMVKAVAEKEAEGRCTLEAENGRLAEDVARLKEEASQSRGLVDSLRLQLHDASEVSRKTSMISLARTTSEVANVTQSLLKLRGGCRESGSLEGVDGVEGASIMTEGRRVESMAIGLDPRGASTIHLAMSVRTCLRRERDRDRDQDSRHVEDCVLKLFSVDGQRVVELGSLEIQGGDVFLSPSVYGHVFVCHASDGKTSCYNVPLGVTVHSQYLSLVRLVPFPAVPGSLLGLRRGGWTTTLHVVRADGDVRRVRNTVRGGKVLEVDSSGRFCLTGGYTIEENETLRKHEVVIYGVDGEEFIWKSQVVISCALQQQPLVKFFPSRNDVPPTAHFVSLCKTGVILYEFSNDTLRVLREIEVYSYAMALSLPNPFFHDSAAWLVSVNGSKTWVQNILAEDPHEYLELKYGSPKETQLLTVDPGCTAIAAYHKDTQVVIWSRRQGSQHKT